MSEAPLELLPDGVYLNLPERRYFAQRRLGSTDIMAYFLKKEGAWWSSPDNPDYVAEAEDAGARTFGKALHALVLEGDAAYAERFATMPTKAEMAARHGELFCVTLPDMERALEKRGMNPKRMKKEEMIPYVRSRAPDLIVWDDYQAQWKKENEGKGSLSGEEHRQLMIMGELVRNHDEIGKFFAYDAEHIPLTEVSILWTEQHGIRTVRRRARLDAFFPQQTVDLKALTNIGTRPLNFAVGDHMAKYAYQAQMADHHIARRHAYRMIQDGRVFDGVALEDRTEATTTRFLEHKAWLDRFPTEAANWEYLWIFFQRPDSRAGKAPIIFPWQEDYGSDLHLDGIRARRQAYATYIQGMAQFGHDKPWTRVEPVHTSREMRNNNNRVFVPAHVAQPYMAGEEEDL